VAAAGRPCCARHAVALSTRRCATLVCGLLHCFCDFLLGRVSLHGQYRALRQAGSAKYCSEVLADAVHCEIVLLLLRPCPIEPNFLKILSLFLTLFQILSPIIGHGFRVVLSYLHLNAILSLSIVLAAAAVWVSFALPDVDQSSNDFTAQLGRAFLDPLPAGALLLLMTDSATNSVPRLCRFTRTVHVALLTLHRCALCKLLTGIAPMCLCWIKI
jgi:hypothetical protein